MSSLMAIIMVYYIYIYYTEMTVMYLVSHNGKFLRLNRHFGFNNIKALYEKLESSQYYQWEVIPPYFVSRKLFKEFNNWEDFKRFPETHPEYFI